MRAWRATRRAPWSTRTSHCKMRWLSFALISKLHARRLRLIGLYEEQGISRERVLIKARACDAVPS